jgi:hypothetical protein
LPEESEGEEIRAKDIADRMRMNVHSLPENCGAIASGRAARRRGPDPSGEVFEVGIAKTKRIFSERNSVASLCLSEIFSNH